MRRQLEVLMQRLRFFWHRRRRTDNIVSPEAERQRLKQAILRRALREVAAELYQQKIRQDAEALVLPLATGRVTVPKVADFCDLFLAAEDAVQSHLVASGFTSPWIKEIAAEAERNDALGLK